MAYSDVVLADAPRAYWQMDDYATNGMRDSSGFARHGTNLGTAPTVRAGIQGNGLTYAGATGAGSDIGASNIIGTGLTAMSLEAWFLASTSLPMQILIGARDYLGATGNNNYQLSLSNGQVVVAFFTGSGFAQVTSIPTFLDSMWHHAVGTYDGANVRLYVDGTYVAGSVLAGGAVNSGAGARLRLANYSYTNVAITGSIDEAAIYSTALSAERVTAHYLAGIDGLPADRYINTFEAHIASNDPAGGIRYLDLFEVPVASTSEVIADGPAEVPANVTVWDGAAEVDSSVSVV